MIILNLIQNVALLVALAAAYQVVGSRFEKNAFGYQIVSGLLFGGVGLVGMMTPINFMPGVIFDGRSIILSVSGLFGGPVVAGIAALMCGAYRLWLGGAGAMVGVGVIAEAATLGVLFHFLWRGEPRNIGNASLYLFGLLVHLIMLALMFALPARAGYEVLRRIGLPIIVIYPVAVMLVCRLFLDYEERIRDRRSLDESQQRLLEAQRIAKMGDFTWDVETGEVTWSDALFELLGYDKTETLDYGEVNANIHHADDVDRITRWLEKCIESGKDELTSNEYRLVRKNGETLFVRTVGVIQRRPGRKPFIFATVQDITERKLAEQALQKSESFQKALITASPVALYSIDFKGNVLSWNESSERIFGWKADEVIGRPLPIVPDEKEEEFRKLRGRVMAGESFSQVELVRLKKGGTPFHCSLSTAPIYNDSSEVTAIMAALEDITERKKSETALRESEERFRDVFQSANVGKSITSPTGIISVNRAFATMLGYTPEELQDKTWRELTPTDEIDAIELKLAPLFEGSEHSARFNKRYVHKNGSHIWADVSVTLRRDEEGKPLYFITTIVDVTEQKRMEGDLRESESSARALNRRLRDLQQAIAKLASARNMDDIMAVTRSAARRLTEADGAVRL